MKSSESSKKTTAKKLRILMARPPSDFRVQHAAEATGRGKGRKATQLEDYQVRATTLGPPRVAGNMVVANCVARSRGPDQAWCSRLPMKYLHRSRDPDRNKYFIEGTFNTTTILINPPAPSGATRLWGHVVNAAICYPAFLSMLLAS